MRSSFLRLQTILHRPAETRIGHVRAPLVAAILGMVLAGCSEDSGGPLVPYEGSRPLTFLRVTQNFTPDIQWLGGRVAAMGVNRGTTASLDSTLVWLVSAPENSIGSYVTFGFASDSLTIVQYGGTPVDSLSDNTVYTFWMSERSAFDNFDKLPQRYALIARLASYVCSDSSDSVGCRQDSTLTADSLYILESLYFGPRFVDTTLTLQLFVRGTSGGQAGLLTSIRIRREETILTDKYIVTWTPSGVGFRQLAIRRGSTGAFTELIWHVVWPTLSDSIRTPVDVGVVPQGAQEAIAFAESEFAGFNKGTTYFVWMATRTWSGSFSPSAPGYAWFRAFQF